jgi:HEAT repeat protein
LWHVAGPGRRRDDSGRRFQCKRVKLSISEAAVSSSLRRAGLANRGGLLGADRLFRASAFALVAVDPEGKTAVPALAAALKEPDSAVRQAAARALGEL